MKDIGVMIIGSGKVYDRYGKLVNDCEWYYGTESDTDYEGDGSEPLNMGMKHLKLTDNCVLVDWDASLLLNLESIEIGNDCFESVKTFQIDGLNRLKTIKIGSNSFTQVKKADWKMDLRKANNQSKLQSIQIGKVRSRSNSFYYGSSFVIRGIDII